jgi:hypothetical protein
LTEKTVVVSSRIPPSTLALLGQVSGITKLSVSRLVNAAITQWIRNMPPEMPMELQIQATRQTMQQQIQIIKDLRWIYYQAEEANMKLKHLRRKHSAEKRYFPRHVIRTLKELEHTIIQAQKQLDKWLRQNKRSMRSNGQSCKV